MGTVCGYLREDGVELGGLILSTYRGPGRPPAVASGASPFVPKSAALLDQRLIQPGWSWWTQLAPRQL
ncbi:hypothetical protein RJT34_24118 [Clitoria ternatea]|uniref:Uncharacterized protein n=1 Tax=Clitoria ternatea TaxID=43366 RepID=A0AAN9FMG6_CLITE